VVAIPFPLSSAPGVKPQEAAGRLINAYAQATGEGARAPVRWTRTPGLLEKFDVAGHSHLRGGIVSASTLVTVFDERVYTVTKSGTVYTSVNRGELAGTKPVTCAVNNNATPQIACVDVDNGAFELSTSGAPINYSDADVGSPNSVSCLHGYFLFTYGSGTVKASNLNSVSIASNSFTTEQGLSIRRGVVFDDRFFAFGDKWTGVYQDIGASPFPLERTTSIPRGIIGTFAVAGWEPGWKNQLIWVGDDGLVYTLNGYVPAVISNPSVERSIASAADQSLIEASVYMSDGNPVFVLTSPDEWTWEYNAKTQNWNERESYGQDGWRGSQCIKAFNLWLAGDRSTGKVSSIDASHYREIGNPLVFEVESGVIASFPARLAAPRAEFDITAAVGIASGEDPVQTDPSALIYWSRDGGYSYGNPVTRKIGKQGQSEKSVYVSRLGLIKAKGLRFKIQIADPIHVALMGGQVASQALSE